MKNLIAFFAKQGVFADLLTVSIILVGIASAFMIRREVFPNVNFDVISVNTPYPGASPEEVEKLLTNPIEQDLKEVDGIKRLVSISREGASFLTLQLDPDQTTSDKAKEDIKSALDRVTDLPDQAEDSVVTILESKMQPIMEVSLAADIPEMELRKVAKAMEQELERVSGVAKITTRGLRDLEIRVEADPRKLALYHLSLDEMIRALKSQNLSIPGGTITVTGPNNQSLEKIVRTMGEFEGTKDVENTVIRANELGRAVRVGDVAKVFYDFEDSASLNRTNGFPAINLIVLKKEKADAIDVVDMVKEKVDALRPTLPAGLEIQYINDNSYYIRRRLSILTGNLGFGLVLVLLVLSLVLPVRVAFVTALGIPLAFLGTLIYFNWTNQGINLISLIGLIIVVGMLVDDAIVVTENSVRHMEEGMDPQEAAIRGTQEVWGPVTASVLTTITAFLPMMFMSGIMGKFIIQIPVAVVSALLISLFECFFILPHHISAWIKIKKERKTQKPKGLVRRVLYATNHVWDNKVVPRYMKVVKFCLRRRYLISAGVGGLFVFSLVVAGSTMKFVLFPPEGIEIFFIRTQSPLGTPLEKTSELVKPIEKVVKTLPKEELDDFVTFVGIQAQDNMDPNTKRGDEYAQLAVYLTPETDRERSAKQIIDDLRSKLVAKDLGLTKLTFERVNPGPPVGKPVNVGVRGTTYDKILEAVNHLKKTISQWNGVTDVEDSYTVGKKELRVHVDTAEAAAAGLTVSSIGTTVRAAFEGLVPTTIRRLDESVEIRVSLPKSVQTSQQVLEDLLIPNSMGNLVPLRQVARIEDGQGLALFEHEDNRRQVRVMGDVDLKVASATEVNDRIRKMVPDLEKQFPGITFNFGGEDEDTKESMASLFRAYGVALLGIFLILVMMFKNLLQPLLVMVITIPLGVICVLWAFIVNGLPLSFMGMLGVVALAGVIVNNAIVFMDFVNGERANGKDRWESIINAAQVRIRPIFLTTTTTVVGILPTAYGIGGLDKFVVPIAMALGWGLLFGSVLVSVAFPPALAITDDIGMWINRKFKRYADEGAVGSTHLAQEEEK